MCVYLNYQSFVTSYSKREKLFQISSNFTLRLNLVFHNIIVLFICEIQQHFCAVIAYVRSFHTQNQFFLRETPRFSREGDFSRIIEIFADFGNAFLFSFVCFENLFTLRQKGSRNDYIICPFYFVLFTKSRKSCLILFLSCQ